MLGKSRRTSTTLLALLLVIALVGSVDRDAARAEEPTSEDIIEALKPKPEVPGRRRTRSMRGVTVEPGAESKPPSIDLYINFKFDSAELEPDALLTLKSLGQALQSPELKDARIQIIGHTDGKGSDSYNEKLSEQRANAVQKLLVAIYDIDPAHVEAFGRGESELKDRSQPEDGINRRVEIRNVAE
jgi:outer membrane protein OmpA-like peptidoglycan-associated protein